MIEPIGFDVIQKICLEVNVEQKRVLLQAALVGQVEILEPSMCHQLPQPLIFHNFIRWGLSFQRVMKHSTKWSVSHCNSKHYQTSICYSMQKRHTTIHEVFFSWDIVGDHSEVRNELITTYTIDVLPLFYVRLYKQFKSWMRVGNT